MFSHLRVIVRSIVNVIYHRRAPRQRPRRLARGPNHGVARIATQRAGRRLINLARLLRLNVDVRVVRNL